MKSFSLRISKENELAVLNCFLHGGNKKRPAVLVCPGGAYRSLADYEGDVVAKKYYKEGNYNVSPMSDEELEARLNGLIGAMERDNSDLADKQKLMENYDIAMEKSLQAIDYKGLYVDDVKEKLLKFF